jgi:acetylornithine/succinyldiaminopimelate/putrescine aminotransferase
MRVVSIEGGWHGRTVATLAVTDGRRYEAAARRAGIPISRKVPFGDVRAIEAAVGEDVAAVIVEPVQGIAGARDCSVEFLRAARAACDRAGAALVFDEVQCGVGRCGGFTAAEAYGVVPDVLAMAKGLAAGLPIGAVVAAPWLTAKLEIGDLGSTFGGGPVVCAAALAVLDAIEDEDLVANAIAIGGHLADGACAIGIPAVQGRGLLLGLRLGYPARRLQEALFEHRVLAGTATDPEVLRLMPPLNLTRGEADHLLDALRKAWKR